MASDPSMNTYLPPTDPAAAPGSTAQVFARSQTAPSALSPTSNVVTQASELPKPTPLAARSFLPPSALGNSPPRLPVVGSTDFKDPATSRRRPGTHWADMGLLGMAAVGGLFCWRTRRESPLGPR